VSLLVVKVGGSVAETSAAAVLELARGDAVCVVHGAGPQISAELERAGIPVEFRDGLRVTSPAAIDVVRASLEAVNRALCAAIGERALPLAGDAVALPATRIPELGLTGTAAPSRPPAILAALEAGRIPVVAPVGEGPLNVNADQAAAALAVGLGADRLVFLTDVEGLILDGGVVDSIDPAAASALLRGGTLEGGIIPKLGAALEAARQGIPASIGRTRLEPPPAGDPPATALSGARGRAAEGGGS
jgi:acetylglutamate kinase